jgi:hypothetical protein
MHAFRGQRKVIIEHPITGVSSSSKYCAEECRRNHINGIIQSYQLQQMMAFDKSKTA